MMNTKFYEHFEKLLYEKINEKWNPDQPIMYEIITFLQDEFLNVYFEDDNANKLVINSNGQVQINYKSSSEF